MSETLQRTLSKRKTAPKEETVTVVADKKPAIQMGYALVQRSDMNAEMKPEVMEICVVACEKFADDVGCIARCIQEELVKKYFGNWQVVAGETFGFEITHLVKQLFYTYYGGNLAILVWKI